MENKTPEKPDFRKLWENPQSKAAIKLLMYFVFIGLVLLSIKSASSASNLNVKKEKKITIQDMKQDLLENNFQYEYIVVDNEDNKTIFKGNIIDKYNEGTKENVEKTTKYIIDETGIYETVLGEKNLIDNLYENVDEKFINVEYILNLIKDKSTFISKRDGKKEYNYTFLIDDIECDIVVRTDNEKINNIYIEYNESVYDLNFIIDN